MDITGVETGFATVNHAQLYYEIAGEGQPFVMIHAGIADSRQWNNEFAHFSERFRVLRYDLRGYGKSEPVEGEYSHLADLSALLDRLHLDQPLILMGCSMGGSLALNFALTYPSGVKALILVDSGPTGLELDTPDPDELFKEAEQAYDSGDLERASEIETRIWFDGMGRNPDQVDQAMRRLVYEMNYIALSNQAKGLGVRTPDTAFPAAARLGELDMPVLILIGDQDLPYMIAAADYMVERISSARKMIIEDAAHLPNMDQHEKFQKIVSTFLEEIGPGN